MWWLLPLIPLAYGLIRWRGARHLPSLGFSFTPLWKHASTTWRVNAQTWLPPILRAVALFCLVAALARLQKGHSSSISHTKGTDIMLCLDTSGSMRAEDLQPNRMNVAKQVAIDFVKGRRHDRIGVVVFGGISFTQCPLTVDGDALINLLDHVEVGITQTENTAIGSGLVTSVSRLKDSEAQSKLIILVTDGRSNGGEVDPFTAAKTAEALGIKIYTIGVGGHGPAPLPIQDPLFGKRYVQLQEDLDEDTLTKIAEATGGQYFRAASGESLKKVYAQIDAMEKTDFQVTEYTNYTDLYLPFATTALCLMLGEILLTRTVLRRIP